MFILVICMSQIFAADVQTEVILSGDQSEFRYLFIFKETEDYSSFSFEKPKDARIIYAKDNLGKSIRYSVAGDYYIFRPEDIASKTFDIRFTSQSVSDYIKTKNAFSSYVNFNFPVENLRFKLSTKNLNREIIDVFPRDFTTSDNRDYIWTLKGLEQDTLFLVNFEPRENDNFTTTISPTNMYYLGAALLIIVIIATIVLIFGRKRYQKEEKTTEKVIVQKVVNEKGEELETKIETQKVEISFEEIVDKYLTENEKEVAEIVKDNKGISQYDILNFLPHLTKSNLSKIITKLHNKKFLSRIRVGKVNKIYLGEKLDDKK